MRFLSKGLCCFLLACVVLILFLHADFFNNYVSFRLGFGEAKNAGASAVISNVDTNEKLKDDTVFNLCYDGKVWTFNAKDFILDSKVFSIIGRINGLNRNGSRDDKIRLINKLIKINIAPDVAFNYIYYGFNNKLNKIEKNINKMPQNAEIKIKNGKLNIKNEVVGIKFNKYLFYENIIKLYNSGKKIINIDIPIIKILPDITSEQLKKYTYKRGEFSTSISTSSSGRKYNVRKALNSINGTKLGKTEKFSFNDCVGRRTEERGYKTAKIILDGEFVEGTGGGVCQVSSTLYNAALLSGLKVTQSQKHSQRVGYVKAGFDAMVNYGTSDLVFENNTEGDIYILCKYTDSQITISIYGASLNNVSYDREYEIVNYVSAGEKEIVYDTDEKYIDKVIYTDESFELKKARDGYTIKSYIVKYVDDVKVDKKLLRIDKYLPQHSVIVYGAKERQESELPNFNDIIS